MDKPLKNINLVVLVVALMALGSTAAAQEVQKKTERAKPEVATLSFVANGGGCAGGSAFCCFHDQKTAQKALEKVDGVTKVVMDTKTEQVRIEYERGNLSLGELVQAAKKAGHELVVQ